MKGLITKKEALEFKRRWKAVNEAELKELRRTSPAKKFRQLLVLMQCVKDFGWDEALKEGEAEVRVRWLKLKKLYKV
jgi:hypothetical protein